MLKARTKGKVTEAGWSWKVMGSSGGALQSASHGRVLYTADPVPAWSRVTVRATSLKDPSAFGEAIIDVLPGEIFKIIGQVLGPRWIMEGSGAPSPIRLQIDDPGLFTLFGSYTFNAEIHGPELDGCDWEIQPPIGVLTRRITPEASRVDSMHYQPPVARQHGIWLRIRITNRENPSLSLTTRFYLPLNYRPRAGRFGVSF
ncbi:MAG: hypothetical protein P4L36_20280 [Holophaga sp.]|nr:hypothetical protein [Holophaga sp.]